MIDVTAAPYYVRGDGSDCTARIQAALDMVPDAGTTVVIPAGVYGINGVNATQPARREMVGGGLRPKSGTTLVLERGAVLQIIPNRSPAYAGIYVGPDQDGVTIRGGGTIQGDRATHDYTGHTRTLDRTHEWGYGVYAHGCRDLTVEGITISEMTGDGVCIGSLGLLGISPVYGAPERATVRGCHIHANRRNGIAVLACEIAHLADNLITDTGVADAASDGIAPKFGIDLEGYETMLPEYVQHQIPRQVTVSGNMFRGNVSGAVVNYNGHDCVIRGNTADGVISYGCSMRTVLASNVVTGAPIGISGNNTRPSGAVITGNVVTGGATGIDLRGRDVVAQGNLVTDMTAVGISISDATGALVQGNQVTRAARGVNIVSGDQVSILSNRLAQIAREGITDAAAVTGTVVDGNTLRDVGTGVRCSGEMVASRNHVRSPTGNAFQVQSGGRADITGNTVIGAPAYAVTTNTLLTGSVRVAGNSFRGSAPLTVLIIGGDAAARVSVTDNDIDLDRPTAGTAGVWIKGLTGARVVGNRIGSSGVGTYAAAIRADESTASVVGANIVGKLPVVTAPTDTTAP